MYLIFSVYLKQEMSLDISNNCFVKKDFVLYKNLDDLENIHFRDIFILAALNNFALVKIQSMAQMCCLMIKKRHFHFNNIALGEYIHDVIN